MARQQAESGAIRSAVVGVGHLGRIHARFLASLKSSYLVGVCDTDAKRAGQVADDFDDCRPCRTLDELLETRPDFAVVATPTMSHYEVAKPLLEAGVAVLLEKPFTRTLAEADKLLELAGSRHGSFLGVGHVERFNPVVQSARSHVDDPVYIECDRVSAFSFRSLDVGVVLDLMIHDIDLVFWLAGSPLESLESVGASVLSESEDMAYARLRFRNGCIAVVRASRVSLRKMRKLRVFCPDLYVSLDFISREGTTIKVREGSKEKIHEAARAGSLNALTFAQFIEINNLIVEEDQPLRAELKAFLEALRNGKPPPVRGEEGREALACALRIQDEIRRHGAKVRDARKNLTEPP